MVRVFRRAGESGEGEPGGVDSQSAALRAQIAEQTAIGKGRATPTRREREAANQRPLVSNDRRAANKAARAKLAESRERARIGMANGEERYLRVADRGPQRRFVRDYVDARFSVGEALIPVLFVFILGSLIPQIANYLFLLVWLFFLASIVDAVILAAILRRKIRARFGQQSLKRGTGWYAGMRAIQLRPLRLPKAQVRRFAWPD